MSAIPLFPRGVPHPADARRAVAALHLADEAACVEALLPAATFDPAARERVAAAALALARAARAGPSPLEQFLAEYDLATPEGGVLLGLAETLLRIPDAATADRLLRDRLGAGDWARHLGHSASPLVNAATRGLLVGRRAAGGHGPDRLLQRLARHGSGPAVRVAVRRAVGLLARHYVYGRTIGEALAHARRAPEERHSFDMLGEAAMTADEADHYFAAYRGAIAAVAASVDDRVPLYARPGISVKLSALHPRYEYAQRERLLAELAPRLQRLAHAARDAGITLTVDAEEARRLDLSLDLFEALFADPALTGWDGLGLAVQAYQKRALPLIDWAAELAGRHRRRIPLRLVKGAYWDTEVKAAQQEGLEGYPVFTRKLHTDLSYLACASRLFAASDRLYPQFATHNAHTVAALLELAGTRWDWEFQRLHGMGVALYAAVRQRYGRPCRVYAPVGAHATLLPYLVRRLLENGANGSFVNRIADPQTPLAALVMDPAESVRRLPQGGGLPLPPELYGDQRRNAAGLPFGDPLALAGLERELRAALGEPWQAAPLIAGRPAAGEARAVSAPGDRRRVIGSVVEADADTAAAAIATAAAAFPAWSRRPVEERAATLERAADLIEAGRAGLIARITQEGGRSVPNALAELREAADFCRYYAAQARRTLAPRELPGPTGERNIWSTEGRGVFLCISPWNFPAAIFTGQVAAALVAGNAVVAKPARATPLTAGRVVELLHAAGVPEDVLNLLPGPSGTVADTLLAHPALAGVAFTGSTATARRIARALAAREGPLVPLVAETGGLNAMVVDSSALPEQVVADAIRSAFDSAGQRCSALRVLCLQEEVAGRIEAMLAGAIRELQVGDPLLLATDVGPVIDAAAREALLAHRERMGREARLIAEAPLPAATAHGHFVAPCAFAVDNIEQIGGEVFGPYLHLLRYRADRLDAMVDAINATGYGLTFGVHSRIETTYRRVAERVGAGNVYVNRDLIGAVVGVQPFGGRGLSGTGPKAGGPHYLTAFVHEKVVSENTAAIGGDAALLGGVRTVNSGKAWPGTDGG